MAQPLKASPGSLAKVELTLYVPENLRTQLRIEAARTGRKMSDIAVDAIRSALTRRDVERHNTRKSRRKEK